MKLPENFEARPLRRGGFSYRVKLPDGSKINLGWNLEEAVERYRSLYVAPDEIGLENAAAEIYARQKKGAKQRGIAFELEVGCIKRLLMAQRFRCAVTGRRFSLERLDGVRARPYAPSLDRIDNRQPYTEDNCRLVCSAINAALSDLGEERFLELLEPLIRKRVRAEIERLSGGNATSGTRMDAGVSSDE